MALDGSNKHPPTDLFGLLVDPYASHRRLENATSCSELHRWTNQPHFDDSPGRQRQRIALESFSVIL